MPVQGIELRPVLSPAADAAGGVRARWRSPETLTWLVAAVPLKYSQVTSPSVAYPQVRPACHPHPASDQAPAAPHPAAAAAAAAAPGAPARVFLRKTHILLRGCAVNRPTGATTKPRTGAHRPRSSDDAWVLWLLIFGGETPPNRPAEPTALAYNELDTTNQDQQPPHLCITDDHRPGAGPARTLHPRAAHPRRRPSRP